MKTTSSLILCLVIFHSAYAKVDSKKVSCDKVKVKAKTNKKITQNVKPVPERKIASEQLESLKSLQTDITFGSKADQENEAATFSESLSIELKLPEKNENRFHKTDLKKPIAQAEKITDLEVKSSEENLLQKLCEKDRVIDDLRAQLNSSLPLTPKVLATITPKVSASNKIASDDQSSQMELLASMTQMMLTQMENQNRLMGQMLEHFRSTNQLLIDRAFNAPTQVRTYEANRGSFAEDLNPELAFYRNYYYAQQNKRSELQYSTDFSHQLSHQLSHQSSNQEVNKNFNPSEQVTSSLASTTSSSPNNINNVFGIRGFDFRQEQEGQTLKLPQLVREFF